MKAHHIKSIAAVIAIFALAANSFSADGPPNSSALQPALDGQGRFWVYRNGPNRPKIPFSPYGWMSDATNLSQIISMELDSRDHPNTTTKAPGGEREYCMRVKFTWGDASWAGVAFISGPDKPPWWADTNGGKYYNLGNLPKKRLIFYARGEKGGEVIKAQVGVLGEKSFGDSLPKPVASDDIKLTTDWTRHEIDLGSVPAGDLARICSGFDVMAERSSQPGSSGEIQFYIDDVYFE